MANLLNDTVVAQRNPMLVQLPITSLVDQFPNTLQVRVSEERIDVSDFRTSQ
jgi:hypothetical protein